MVLAYYLNSKLYVILCDVECLSTDLIMATRGEVLPSTTPTWYTELTRPFLTLSSQLTKPPCPLQPPSSSLSSCKVNPSPFHHLTFLVVVSDHPTVSCATHSLPQTNYHLPSCSCLLSSIKYTHCSFDKISHLPYPFVLSLRDVSLLHF